MFCLKDYQQNIEIFYTPILLHYLKVLYIASHKTTEKIFRETLNIVITKITCLQMMCHSNLLSVCFISRVNGFCYKMSLDVCL